jgi:glycosyltransferase involved in cell wall biosynthesis
MKISIIVPVYHVENYITACLESVKNQDYEGEIECILIDDCGKDKSITCIENYISSNAKKGLVFKILHHEKNRGLSAARNTGMDAATGDYLYFLDSDDTIEPNAIRLLTAPLKKKKYDFVTANYQFTGTDVKAPVMTINEGEYLGNEPIVNTYHTQWFAMAWNKLVSKDFLKSNSLYFKEGLIREDELWSFKLACTATSMYVIHATTYNYLLQRKDSIMAATDQIKKIDAMRTVMAGWVETAQAYSHEYSQQHLYYLLEMTKRNCFIDAQDCMDDAKRLNLYKQLRTLSLPLPISMPPGKKLAIWVRDFHYSPLIPVKLGYSYMSMMVRLAIIVRRFKKRLS